LKILGAFFVAVILTLTVGVPLSLLVKDNAVAAARSTYYAQGVADGKVQAQSKAPAAVQKMVQGFCDGTLNLDWFDASMGVTPSDVDNYAAKTHDCAGTRFLGSIPVTRYTGETGTEYIFVIDANSVETWWVFTLNAAGKVVDIQ
jgi:hypothetical protein